MKQHLCSNIEEIWHNGISVDFLYRPIEQNYYISKKRTLHFIAKTRNDFYFALGIIFYQIRKMVKIMSIYNIYSRDIKSSFDLKNVLKD